LQKSPHIMSRSHFPQNKVGHFLSPKIDKIVDVYAKSGESPAAAMERVKHAHGATGDPVHKSFLTKF